MLNLKIFRQLSTYLLGNFCLFSLDRHLYEEISSNNCHSTNWGDTDAPYCHIRLHLVFSALLKILQIAACKMEPRSGTIITEPASQPATRVPTLIYRCHPNWSNDSYSKIFLRINVGPKKTSSDNCTKKDFQQICLNNFKFDIYSKKIYL